MDGDKKRARGFLKSNVPRPLEKWITNLLWEKKWDNVDADIDWLKRLRRLAGESGCRIRFDPDWHWKESRYCPGRADGATILAGGAGNPKYGCTSILHELGHHILHAESRHPGDMLKAEKAAWEIALDMARKHRLPFVPHIKKQALHSYRLGIMLEASTGSKRRARRRAAPKSWQLEDSRRSRTISTGYGLYSLGKKGRRYAKKFIKKATARTERRKLVVEA